MISDDMTTITADSLTEPLHFCIERARAAERIGALDDALYWFERAFCRLPLEGSAASAAELLRWIGTLHRQRGHLDLATEAYDASLTIAELNTLRQHVASAFNCQAIVAQHRGQVGEAESLYARARLLASQAGDERLAAMIDQNLGTLANTRGQVDTAIASYSSALSRLRRLGDDAACALALNNLGMAHVDIEQWEIAEQCFDEAFELADRLRDTGLLGMVELNRAELYLKRRAFARARECCDRAFEIFTRLDARGSLGETYKFYGVLYREMQRPGLADAHFEAAASLAGMAEDRLLEAEALSEWAIVDLQAARNTDALRRLNRAHSLFLELHADLDLLDIEARLDRLEQTYLRVVAQWAESIESKDRYTAGHCERVADYACLLARAVGFAGRDLKWFRMGGYLHDVGKTSVPADVLNKPGRLTDQEWSLMQQHTVVGDEIVAALNFPWDIRPLVRNHHERWDGTGYPDRLAGSDIPLTARILCVADVFDALTTARSYRPALSRADALRVMERDVEKVFDPELFALFKKLVGNDLEAAA
jgi:putative nucleotidyltransferase with HDIG domain